MPKVYWLSLGHVISCVYMSGVLFIEITHVGKITVVRMVLPVPTFGISNTLKCLPAIHPSSSNKYRFHQINYSKSDSQVFTSPVVN